MPIQFYKYQGTGNDFLLADNRKNDIQLTEKKIAWLCNRHFGIGADGLMLLDEAAGYDFRMVYYNSDGKLSSMCGNGGRCITAFAKRLGIIEDKTFFIATDGPHHSMIHEDGTVSLEMKDVKEIQLHTEYTILDTGSPHYVRFHDAVDVMNIVNEGREIRNSEPYKAEGINVNFVQRMEDGIFVRTYERGVEDETLSCGTGVTASAIAASGNETGYFKTGIKTPGGSLVVSFEKDSPVSARNVILSGPAEYVFEVKMDT